MNIEIKSLVVYLTSYFYVLFRKEFTNIGIHYVQASVTFSVVLLNKFWNKILMISLFSESNIVVVDLCLKFAAHSEFASALNMCNHNIYH